MKTEQQWNRIGKRSHHGIALSLASLRSKKSCGIGEFLDLLPMIDWCSELGLDVIQLLPLNDSGSDPSPYNALSSCALDPIYLSLWALPKSRFIDGDLTPFIPLTESNRIQYPAVRQAKIRWLTRYYHEQFDANLATYQTFLHNHPWVRPYALFKAYKEEHGGRYWKEWPESENHPTLKAMEEKHPLVEFYCFLQYLCHEQLTQVKQRADEKKVFLKGDVPILISPDSADVWAEPHLFDQAFVAGAPPDYYNPLGQKWGFPLYNWPAIEKEDFAWWKRRLQSMSEYFHLYRLDHIVGFFRIWAIPQDKKAADGHFEPQNTALWPDHGRKILEKLIDASPLLPIGEDLGTIPVFVRPLMKQLGICGTKVIRWERDWHKDKSYFPYNTYEPLSVTTVSTHDSETLTLWWEKYPDEAKAFARFNHWDYQPHLTQEQRYATLRLSHQTSSYFHINLLQETLALFPELVWPNPEDERLNIPGTLLPTNWTYRYRPFIEEIISHSGLSDTFRRLIS